MKAVILAGGLGTRLSEETIVKPKPLVEIGGFPILWHILKNYSHHGINEFIICLGYKGYILHMSNVTIDIKNNTTEIHDVNAEPWKITLIDTGKDTMTGGRIKRIEKYIDDTFCLTYGDGISNVNIRESINFHKNSGLIGTVTAIQPPGRFGALKIKENMIEHFIEKPKGDSSWINGGFFVFEQKLFEFLKNDQTILEREPLEQLSNINQLGVFKHDGFWQAMDTLREKEYLERLWTQNNAPWKVW
ncbi:MAG: glucose-1-phosphate cytidylyltransferase [Thaumarchaeota archaeon]|nr:MAG: glucose-1-phosphate cytidylyltransferase [Nitrososphaerota archaeon]